MLFLGKGVIGILDAGDVDVSVRQGSPAYGCPDGGIKLLCGQIVRAEGNENGMCRCMQGAHHVIDKIRPWLSWGPDGRPHGAEKPADGGDQRFG